MTKNNLEGFSKNINKIASNFEEKAWTDNVKFLKEDFEIKNVEAPKHYLNVLYELKEITRQTRLLYVLSVLEKVCVEEGKIYNFKKPYQANMQYSGIFKKENTFYLVDEDGDFRDVFTSESFIQFIHAEYWELYE